MRITRSVFIDTDHERLWLLLTDDEKLRLWNPDIVTHEIIDDRGGVGTRSRMTIREGSREVEYESEITGYAEPSELAIRLTGGSLGKGPMDVRYTVTGDPGALEVRFVSEWYGQGLLLKLLTPLITLAGRRNARVAMDLGFGLVRTGAPTRRC